MKISAEYKNPNLYEIAKKREADGKGAADLQMNKDRSPVQVDISKEAMQKYRAELQKNTAAEEENIHWLNTEDNTMQCVKINEKDENGNALTVKEQAQRLLETYASQYQKIAKGYDDGTIKIYSEDEDNRILTKEEALQKLTESLAYHAKSMEEREEQQEKAARMLEESIQKSPAWKNSSQRARQFLEEQDRKRENPEYRPEHFSENIIKAGTTFRDMFASTGQTNTTAISDILTKISLW